VGTGGQGVARVKAFSALLLLSLLALSGCGTIATAAVVTGSVVGTAAGVAVDGVVLVGKGVVKAGEAVVEAVKD
jgi:hypothetical protein